MTALLPTSEQLDDIAGQVWAAFLDDDGTPGPPAADVTETLAASVAMVGAWAGHLVVTCSDAASRQVAAALFALPADEVTADDVGDALGELANVLGGNVKSMLPAPSTLSLPRVAGAGRWPGAAEVCRTVVTWRTHPYTVALLAADDVRARQEVPA